VDELPVVDADPVQMHQLFQNLVGNAIKFRRPGVPPLVRISALPEPDDRSDSAGRRNGGGTRLATREPSGDCTQADLQKPAAKVRIAVEDNGIGFEEKYSERIFDVFQKLHGRGEYDGNGVGLSICRKIAERHKGNIVAQSCPGHGSRFIVTLDQEIRRSGNQGIGRSADQTKPTTRRSDAPVASQAIRKSEDQTILIT
jgi:signal transduction histidine kinase